MYEPYSKLFIAAGNAGTIATSNDAISWTSRVSGYDISTNLTALGYGNGLYLVGGTNGVMSASTDGITWTSRHANFGTSTINDIGFHRNLYVAVGMGGAIRTSTDTISWSTRNSNTGSNLYGTYGAEGIYFAYGDSGRLSTKHQQMTIVQFAQLVTT
jgi:photosystem II stability/assembly factor-like uncharacterized protein